MRRPDYRTTTKCMSEAGGTTNAEVGGDREAASRSISAVHCSAVSERKKKKKRVQFWAGLAG